MKCEEYLLLVEDYFDGELDERTTELVRQHLSACASCMIAHRKLEREQELYRNYECDAQPAPDFWNIVLAKAADESSAEPSHLPGGLRHWFGNAFGSFSAPRFSPSLTALIVLVTIGITAGLMRYFNSGSGKTGTAQISQTAPMPATIPSQTPPEINRPVNPTIKEVVEKGSNREAIVQPQPAKNIAERGRLALAANGGGGVERGSRKTAKSSGTLTPDELVRQAEQKYVAAITMLSRDVKSHRSRLDAESVARFEQTLAAIDRTIAETRRAARQHPGDPVAAQYMLTAYAKKVDVLREMIGY
jgi:hypothetical protein